MASGSGSAAGSAAGSGTGPGRWAARWRGARRAAPARPDRRALVWLHATDPEAASVLQLLARQIGTLRGAPAVHLTGTATDPGPDNRPEAATAHLDRHAPSLLVLSGALLPPTLIEAAARQGVPVFLLDVRRPALQGAARFWPGYLRKLLRGMALIHAADTSAAQTLRGLVQDRVPVEALGPLARYPAARPCNASELEAMRAALAGRTCWLAWSLPEAEEEPALLAHVQALRRSHRLLLILIPRDASRGDALVERARDVGFVCARRALDQDITETTQVYIADTDDEPGLFLRLAAITFLGGSLTREAGSPAPLLAASLGSVLVFGPYPAAEDRALLERLRMARAARRIATPTELGDATAALLAPDISADAALKAWSIATEGADATDAIARRIVEAVRAGVAAGSGALSAP